MKMKYVQIHELISYPASNLNRDDLQRPKTVRMGDSTRLRISSQSLKRAWRVSDVMHEAFPEMGIRTNKLSEYIQEALEKGMTLKELISGGTAVTRQPVDRKIAKEYGASIDDRFRSQKASADDDSDDSDDKKGKKKEKKKQLLHYSPAELDRVDELMARISQGEKPEVPDMLSESDFPVDIAMFGRMVANDARFNCEAAVQVAHAFTVHKGVVEDDFFTAVDDLSGDDDQGAGHLSELGFGAGLFYMYICVDFELLRKNLGSEELARKALLKLIETSATVSPTGKQNTFASRAYASYILVEKGDRQPRSLSSAFLKPVRGDDMLKEAIDSIRRTESNMNSVFGMCYDDSYEMDVSTGTGSFEGLASFLQ